LTVLIRHIPSVWARD